MLLTPLEAVHGGGVAKQTGDAVAQPGGQDSSEDESEVARPGHEYDRLLLPDSSEDAPNNPLLVEDGSVPGVLDPFKHTCVDVVGTDAGCLDVLLILFHFKSQGLINGESAKL